MTHTLKRMRSYTAEELVTQTGFDRRTIAYYIQQGLLPKVGRRGPRTRYPGYVRDRLLFIRSVREAEEAGEIEPMSLSDLRELFEQTHPELIARVADQRLSAADALQALAEPGNVRSDRSPEARHLARERAFRSRASARRSVPNLEAGPGRDTGEDQWIEPDEAEGPGRSAESIEADEPHETAYLAGMSPEFAAGSPGVSDSRQPPVASSPPEERDPAAPEGLAAALSEELSELQFRAQDRQRRKPGLTERWMRVKISPDIALSVRRITDEDAPLLDSAGRHLRRLIGRRGNRRNR